MLAESLSATHVTVSSPLADALVDLGHQRSEVVVLSADLSKWTDVGLFARKFPARFVQVGMAEQNLIGIAGGLAKAGLVPVVVGFGVFLTRRAYDQIAMSLATGPTNAVLVGFLPGVMSRFRGTHQAIEDCALMQSVPGMRVYDPADATEIRQALFQAVSEGGLSYMRADRGDVPRLFDHEDGARLGSRAISTAPGEIGFVTTGLATGWTMDARAELDGPTAHLHVPVLKPFPAAEVADFCGRHRKIISVENHLRTGGLGSSVAMAVADRGLGTRVRRLGLGVEWQAYGSPGFVRAQAGLDPSSIAQAAREELAQSPSEVHR